MYIDILILMSNSMHNININNNINKELCFDKF